MKAIIKGTDVAISVQPIYSADGLHIVQFVNTANGDLFQPHTVDIIPNDTDWNALRNQAAIAAMQSIVKECNINTIDGKTYNKMVAKIAVEMANALIDELKNQSV